MTSIEQSDLTRRRRMRLQGFWRTLVVSSLLGGLSWGMFHPIWILRQPNQIVILGNHLLSAQAVRSILPLSYPKWLLKIEPAAIARSLESQPAIAAATVTRQLFPPRINVQIEERVPIAIAQTLLPKSTSNSARTSVGLLDENGVLMSIQSYTSLSSATELPSLKVIGPPEQYRSYWPQLYQAVRHSPIKVTEIDCQEPANLILKTELGTVHIGPYSSRLPEQLKVLAGMRQLPAHLNSSQLAYIDLKNPDYPSVQMNYSDNNVKSATP